MSNLFDNISKDMQGHISNIDKFNKDIINNINDFNKQLIKLIDDNIVVTSPIAIREKRRHNKRDSISGGKIYNPYND